MAPLFPGRKKSSRPPNRSGAFYMNTPANKYNHYIVAIGASAGGLQGFHAVFDSSPETPDSSFNITHPLSPDYKSLLVELEARHTDMKVYEAADDQEIERKC